MKKFEYITKPENIFQVPFRYMSTIIVKRIHDTKITPNIKPNTNIITVLTFLLMTIYILQKGQLIFFVCN